VEMNITSPLRSLARQDLCYAPFVERERSHLLSARFQRQACISCGSLKAALMRSKIEESFLDTSTTVSDIFVGLFGGFTALFLLVFGGVATGPSFGRYVHPSNVKSDPFPRPMAMCKFDSHTTWFDLSTNESVSGDKLFGPCHFPSYPGSITLIIAAGIYTALLVAIVAGPYFVRMRLHMQVNRKKVRCSRATSS
jgi:hypothetical protein